MVSIRLLSPLVLATFVVAYFPARTYQERPRVSARWKDRHSFGDRPILPRDDCEPAEPSDTVTDRLNGLLSSGGAGFVLTLCQNQNYLITAPLEFTAPNQEIITEGLPTDDSRAILTVSGPTLIPGQDNHTTAVLGQCETCDGVKLRHVQINGMRDDSPPVSGGANIEMGGNNHGQMVEFVHSFNPRSWSCLHIAEGGLKCSDTIVQNNDIGPCGSDAFGQWADGVSIACANTIVQNNLINTPTDGGIVLFGSPGSLVQNNTIWVETNTLLGGINMVDYLPWMGDYTGAIVRQNKIIGGLATDSPTSANDNKGANNETAIIKIGIAIGPRTWFGNHFLANVSQGGTVLENKFEGAFGYAIAVTSAVNFTIQENELVGNTSFIGSRGPNCSRTDQTPQSQPFIVQQTSVDDLDIQSDFDNVVDGDSLNCIVPPPGGDFWPFGGSHSPSAPPPVPGDQTGQTGSSGGSGTGKKVGIAIGVIGGILFVALVFWYSRRRARQVQAAKELQNPPTMVQLTPQYPQYTSKPGQVNY